MNMAAFSIVVAMASFLVYIFSTLAQNDLPCLEEFKASIRDPMRYLDSWTFPSANLCLFAGITCLHQDDSRVYSISLPGSGLVGGFPKGLDKCSSLSGLDLSQNELTGEIPRNLCEILPFLVTFDVHGNAFDGGIDTSFTNCTYLNNLDLSQNKFSGSIPGTISALPRLAKFDVSDNDFSGPFPPSFTMKNFSASSFAGNSRLCGHPLSRQCKTRSAPGGIASLIGATLVFRFGFIFGFVLAFILVSSLTILY